MNNEEIFEDEPLLLNANAGQEKKTYSLNTGLVSPAGNIGYSGDLDQMQSPKHAKTMAVRGMSLATRANIDPVALVEQAKERCKQPIKLSWEDVKFEAEVKTSA